MALGSSKISRSTGGNIAIILFLLFLGLVMALPFFYTILQSLKPLDELFIFPPRFWVKRPSLNNFTMLFSLTESLWVPFSRYLFNTTYLAVLCTAIQVIIASMAAYPLAKHKFPGKGIIFGLVTLSLLFTADVTFLPSYIIISSLHMIDTHWAMIIPSIAYSFGLYLMRQNLIAFPDSVLESARIDGATEWTIFWKIVMPANKAVWMTMIVFSFSGMWSRGDGAYVYSEELKGLPTLLGTISAGGIARAGVAAATSVLMIIPPIIVFMITQSNVIETMASSGMKE